MNKLTMTHKGVEFTVPAGYDSVESFIQVLRMNQLIQPSNPKLAAKYAEFKARDAATIAKFDAIT